MFVNRDKIGQEFINETEINLEVKRKNKNV